MLKEKELLKLKEDYLNSKKEIDSFGAEQFDTVIKLSLELQDLISELEKLKKQQEAINTKSIHYKIKVGKKSAKLYKKMNMLEYALNYEIENENIPPEPGKKMIEIVKLLKANRIQLVPDVFSYFERLLSLNELYIKSKEELSRQRIIVERELNRIERLIKDLEVLNNTVIDEEKLNGYKEYQSDLKRLDSLRLKYLTSLLSLTISELIKKIKEESLLEYGFPAIDDKTLNQLQEFFCQDKFFSGMNITKICEMLGYTKEKIKHIYPQVSEYKRVILPNQSWFEKVSNIKKSNFIVFNLDDKIKQFYSENIPNAKEVIDKIKTYEDKIPEFESEYVKNKWYQSEKERLSGYSKKDLENQLLFYKHLMSMLVLEAGNNRKDHKRNHGRDHERGEEKRGEKDKGKDEEKNNEKDEEKEIGILSMLRSLFKKND